MKERERERKRERERTSGLPQSVRVCFLFFTYFVSCNGPCAPKEKWHRKEHIIIFIIIIIANSGYNYQQTNLPLAVGVLLLAACVTNSE